MARPSEQPDTSWSATAASLLALAGPVLLSRSGIFGLAIIDSVMVGRAGVEELGFLGVAAQPQESLASVGQALVAGLPALVVGARFRGEKGEAERWLVAALSVSAFFGLILASVAAIGGPLLEAAGQAPELVREGGPVLRAFAWGIPAILMFWAGSLYLEALGRPHLPLCIVLAALAVKFLLNLALVSGVAGLIAPLGAVGAALSTSIVRWLMLAAILVAAGIGLRSCSGFRLARVRGVLGVGAPVAVATAFEIGGFLTLAAFAGALGTESMAGYLIARSLYQVPFIASVAVGLSTSIHLASAVEARNLAQARRVVRVGGALAVAIGVGAGLVIVAFPSAAGRLFTDDGAFIATLAVVLQITAVLIVFDGIQGFLFATLRGVSDGLVPSLAQLAAFWGVAVPLAYFLAFELDWRLEGVLGGLTAGLAVASLLLGLRLAAHPRLRQSAV